MDVTDLFEEDEKILKAMYDRGFRVGRKTGSEDQKIFMRLYSRCAKRRERLNLPPLFGTKKSPPRTPTLEDVQKMDPGQPNKRVQKVSPIPVITNLSSSSSYLPVARNSIPQKIQPLIIPVQSLKTIQSNSEEFLNPSIPPTSFPSPIISLTNSSNSIVPPVDLPDLVKSSSSRPSPVHLETLLSIYQRIGRSVIHQDPSENIDEPYLPPIGPWIPQSIDNVNSTEISNKSSPYVLVLPQL